MRRITISSDFGKLLSRDDLLKSSPALDGSRERSETRLYEIGASHRERILDIQPLG